MRRACSVSDRSNSRPLAFPVGRRASDVSSSFFFFSFSFPFFFSSLAFRPSPPLSPSLPPGPGACPRGFGVFWGCVPSRSRRVRPSGRRGLAPPGPLRPGPCARVAPAPRGGGAPGGGLPPPAPGPRALPRVRAPGARARRPARPAPPRPLSPPSSFKDTFSTYQVSEYSFWYSERQEKNFRSIAGPISSFPLLHSLRSLRKREWNDESCAEWGAERPQFGVADLNKTVAKVVARGGLEIAARTGGQNENIFDFLCKVVPPREQPPSKILT